MKLDPERALWLPNRRSFFFLGAAAGVGVLLPKIRQVTQYKFEFWVPDPMPIAEFRSLASVQEIAAYDFLQPFRLPVRLEHPGPGSMSEGSAGPLPSLME